MIWIVSKSLIGSDLELEKRHKYIEEITGARVSPWRECVCKSERFLYRNISYYQCRSEKGEYGVAITAHMNLEVQAILKRELSQKQAIVVINSCKLSKREVKECCSIVRKKNVQSEILFAKQERSPDGLSLNYYSEVGTFGFPTTVSERVMFQNRKNGLIKAVRKAFDKVEM